MRRVWLTRQSAAKAPEGQPVRDEKFVARQKDWQKKFEKLDREALSGWFMDDAAQAARKEIAAIRDPAAVGPLATVFLDQKDVNKRVMAAEALGTIGGDEAGLDLYKVWLHDDDHDVLAAARKALAGMQSTKLSAAMKAALSGSDGQALVRTAELLADAGPSASGTSDSVLRLINSLVTQETRTIRHETTQSQRSWIMDGTQQAYVSSLTPVVAQGAVGFAPTIGVLQTGSVLDVKATVEPWNEHVTQTVPHPEVLDSLRRLTGQDFSYDIGAWRTWYWAHVAQQAAKAAPSDGTGGN